MKIVVLSLLLTMLSGVVFVMVYARGYDKFVGEVEDRCRAMALSHPVIGLQGGQLECKLYHHDIVMKLRISATTRYEVECSPHAYLNKLTIPGCIILEIEKSN